jgi:hypothetical protein
MKASTRGIAGVVSAWIAVVAVVLSAQQPPASTAPPDSTAPPASTAPPSATDEQALSPEEMAARVEHAGKVLQLSCGSTTCHTLRPIQTTAMDRDGWTMEVAAMIQKGAMVDQADQPDLISLLVRDHGPLPEGPGKDILLNTCTICHDLQRVRTRRATPEGWDELLQEMLSEGAPLSDENYPILLTYLARNFRTGS